jgi:hypothetical protein
VSAQASGGHLRRWWRRSGVDEANTGMEWRVKLLFGRPRPSIFRGLSGRQV